MHAVDMRSVVLILLAIFSFVFVAAAQPSSATVSGTVTDTLGLVSENAEVRIVNAQQIVLSATKTDAQGRFRFDGIHNGSYVIMASRSDFSSRSEAVRIDRDNPPAEVKLVLPVNQLSEQVTVTADTGQAEEISKIPQQINIVSQD